MFDIGISEIGLIAVVALIVLGPERLPRVARTVGTLLGRAQRYVNDVKAEVNREIELEELKKLQTQMKEAAASVQQSMSSVGSEVHSAVSDVHAGFEQVGKDMSSAAQSIGQPVASSPSSDIGSGAALPSPLGPAGSNVDPPAVGGIEPSAAGPASSYLYEPLQEPPIPLDEMPAVNMSRDHKSPDNTTGAAHGSAKSLVDPRAAANVRSVPREPHAVAATAEPAQPPGRAKRLRDPRAASNVATDAAANPAPGNDAAAPTEGTVPVDDVTRPVQPSLFR